MAASSDAKTRYTIAATQKRPEVIDIARGLQGTPWCEEYEKMISGMLYNPFTPSFHVTRHRARCLMQEYNNWDMKSTTVETWNIERFKVLQLLLGRVGEGTFIEPVFSVDYGVNISFGKDCYVNSNMMIADAGLVVIGDRVMFGPNVSLITAGHEASVLSRRKQVEFAHPIFIGSDCWIGAGATILPGVTIGEGSTVGAGSVVTRDIPRYTVAYGNPCRPQRQLPTVEEEMADPTNPYVRLKTPELY